MANTQQDSDFVRQSVTGSVCTVTLCRAAAHNALNQHMITGLTAALGSIARDPAIRVVVLAGQGNSFCAGADLQWMKEAGEQTRTENVADSQSVAEMLTILSDLPQVTIARVQGQARGGGAGLAAACDVVVAAESAEFAFSEVRLGLVPALISAFVLQRLAMGTARSLFVTGRVFGAREALRIGLVDRVESHESALDHVVAEIAADVMQCSPDAVARTKRLLRAYPGLHPETYQALAGEAIADARSSAEGQEGTSAFLSKRKPRWADPELIGEPVVKDAVPDSDSSVSR